MNLSEKDGHPIISKAVLIIYDAIAVNLAYFLTFLLRFCIQFNIQENATFALPIMYKFAPIFAVLSVVVFYLFRMYDIRWQYCGLHDLLRIVVACLCTSVIYAVGSIIIFSNIPRSIYFIAPFVEIFLIGLSRVAYKLYLEERNQQINKRSANNRSMVIGADTISRFAVKQFEESKQYRTVAMVDLNRKGSVQYINGTPVIGGLDKLEWALNRYRIGFVVIADSNISDDDRKKIITLCEAKGIEHEDFIEYLQNNNDVQTAVTLKEDGSRVIPFSPPDISEKEIAEVRKALQSGWITTGPRTKELEKRLAEYCGTSKVVCLNSATASEELNFRVCGIGEGDEVIVPAYTYTASASAAIHCGAKVVFVDSQKDNCEMDYDKVAEAITEKTKAIVAVDLGGIVADYDKLFEIVEQKRSLFKAKESNDLGARIQQAVGRVLVFADCAHALGASRNGKMTGSIADFTDFSFHAVKNFTTAEGGASTWRDIPGIDNDEMYHMYQLLSLHGQSKDALAKTKVGAWEYDVIGPWYKCNMTDIMAAIGLRQLDRYPGLLKRRKEIIAKYDKVCDELGVKHLAHFTENSQSSGHLYLTRVPGITDEQRREIITKLAERGVSTNVHYKPLPMMTAYKNLGWDIKDFPNAYAYYENLITLPLHTKLSNADVDYVVKIFKEVVKEYI